MKRTTTASPRTTTASPSPPIHVEYPSVDEAEFEGNPVLRGVVSTPDLPLLRIDPAYQREILSPSTRRHILSGLSERQRLPDIELGMRGQSWDFDPSNSEVVVLYDPVFIIDGQQRRSTILEYLQSNPKELVRQGALIHFGTTMEWERHRFQALNLHQTPVSSGILLRNLRSTNTGIATLYGLTTTEKSFPLYNRVSWNQVMARKDLISAGLYARTILVAHGHMGGGIIATRVEAINTGFDKLVKIIGLRFLRENVAEMWRTIDRVWGVGEINSKRGAHWLSNNFLNAFCDVISDHYDFWTDPLEHKLKVPPSLVSKLEKFPINDPEIKSLASGAGLARRSLQFHLESWLNRHSPMTKRDVTALAYTHRVEAAKEARRREREEREDREEGYPLAAQEEGEMNV